MFSLARLVIVLHLYLAFGHSHDTDTTLFPLHRFSIEYFAPHERYNILLHLCFVHSHHVFFSRVLGYRLRRHVAMQFYFDKKAVISTSPCTSNLNKE